MLLVELKTFPGIVGEQNGRVLQVWSVLGGVVRGALRYLINYSLTNKRLLFIISHRLPSSFTIMIQPTGLGHFNSKTKTVTAVVTLSPI